MKVQAQTLCNPPTPLLNGSFETLTGGSCNLTGCNEGAFNDIPVGSSPDTQCDVTGWIAGIGTPDVCNSFSGVSPFDGDWFAFMDVDVTPSPSCTTEGIVQTLNLMVDCRYELDFAHRTVLNGGAGVDVKVYLVSGFANFSASGGQPCPTPGGGWTLLGTISNFSSNTWTNLATPISFVATSANPQLLLYPTSSSAVNGYWLVDDVTLTPCESSLTPFFSVEPIGPNQYQFTNLTTGTVDAECWDFGDSNTSEDEDPTHTYSGTGPYTVCLTIMDEYGCKKTACQTIGNPCGCGTANLVISEDEAWTSQSFNLGNSLTILPGATLTIDASTVQVATGCGIFVSRGARLEVLEGSILKAWCDGDLWEGITVFGNSLEPHPTVAEVTGGTYPDPLVSLNSQHGVVYAFGSTGEPTTIRDAKIAIGNSSFGLLTGGIMVAEGVTFTENQISGDITKFPSSFSNPSPTEASISRFVDCTFSLNQSLPPVIPTALGIRINGSNAVLVRNCTFTGLGNFAISGVDYTADIQSCTFEGAMPTAVRVDHTQIIQDYQFKVGGEGQTNYFTNTGGSASRGVDAFNVSNLRITDNVFENKIGIRVEGESSFKVEKNIFNENTSGTYGLYLKSTGDNNLNGSQCNIYHDVSFSGIMVIGRNQGFDFNFETFDDEAYRGLYITKLLSTPGEIYQGQGTSGTPVFNLFNASRDIFSQTTSGQSKKFDYFYPNDVDLLLSYPGLHPRCDINLDNCLGTVKNNFVNTGVVPSSTSSGCLDLGLTGGDPPTVIILPSDGDTIRVPLTPDIPDMTTTAGDPVFSGFSCDTSTCISTIRGKARELEALIDGGETDSLLYVVANAPNAGNTFTSLQGASPYLSDEVLLAITGSSMDTARIAIVLLANSPVTDTVFSSADGVVSAGAYQSLEDIRDTVAISDRRLLENLTGQLVRIQQQVISSLTRKFSIDGDFEAAEDMLLYDSTSFANRKLVGLKLRIGEYSAAQGLLNSLPTSTQEETDYRYLQQINLYRLSDTTFVLSSGQEDTLYTIANTSSEQAVFSQTLLYILTDTIFPIYLPDDLEERSSSDWGEREEQVEEAVRQFTLVPNPASGEVKIILPDGLPDATVMMYSATGKTQRVLEVHGGELVFSVASLPEGIYFLKTGAGTNSYHAKLVIRR